MHLNERGQPIFPIVPTSVIQRQGAETARSGTRCNKRPTAHACHSVPTAQITRDRETHYTETAFARENLIIILIFLSSASYIIP